MEAVDLSKEKKRRFHQGPRVTTLNFEAGYMLAVLPETAKTAALAKGAGSIYAPFFRPGTAYIRHIIRMGGVKRQRRMIRF